jgi:hypothetical protein
MVKLLSILKVHSHPVVAMIFILLFYSSIPVLSRKHTQKKLPTSDAAIELFSNFVQVLPQQAESLDIPATGQVLNGQPSVTIDNIDWMDIPLPSQKSHFAGFDEGEGATEDAGAAEGAGAALLPKLNQLLIYISYPQNFFCTIANFKRRPSLREVWRL